MGSSFLALNSQFGGFFQNFWKIFQDKGKNHKIWVTLKCLEFAKWEDDYGNWMCKICKNWRIFQKFWKIFCKINIHKSHQNIDVWKGQSPFQSPIAAKLLEASGEAANKYKKGSLKRLSKATTFFLFYSNLRLTLKTQNFSSLSSSFRF